MKTVSFLISILILLVNLGFAIENKTIAIVGGKEVTNVDIYNTLSEVADEYYGAKVMESYFYKIVDPLLFEDYARDENIVVTDNEVLEDMDNNARESGGANTKEDFLKNKGMYGKSTEDWRRHKVNRKSMLERKIIEHFSPDYSSVTEDDIREYIEFYIKRHFPPVLGTPEAIRYRYSIGTIAEKDADNSNLFLELQTIKKRLNSGECFNDIASEYANSDVFQVSGDYSQYWRTSELSRLGKDSLMSWQSLKGKAVLVRLDEEIVMVLVVDDYMPEKRMNIEDAVNDKDLRNEVITGARGYKFGKAKRRLLDKLRRENVHYVDSQKKVFQELANGYEQWWADTFRNEPDFQKRLSVFMESKKKYLERIAERQ